MYSTTKNTLLTMFITHDPTSLHSVIPPPPLPPYLVKALQHVFHLVVCVGGIFHSHALGGVTGNEACMQEEEQSVVPVRTIETTVKLK